VWTPWEPSQDWDGWVPIVAAQTSVVGAATQGNAPAQGGGGVVQILGALAAALIAGWAAAGVVVAIRGRARPSPIAPIVGFGVGALLWALAGCAIDLAKNPF
jgi:hypothetical protein